VIGIGVNVVSAPQGLAFPATSLAALGRQVHAEDLFAALTDAWIALERIWDGGHGLPAIRLRWLDRAFGLGAPVSIDTGSDILHGVFETLDNEGRLILRAADRSEIAITAGDVHFGHVATASLGQEER
jgi:BirA family biotin operon repressor/biotin-[acetyl-CoA-carboxylase] ligase